MPTRNGFSAPITVEQFLATFPLGVSWISDLDPCALLTHGDVRAVIYISRQLPPESGNKGLINRYPSVPEGATMHSGHELSTSTYTPCDFVSVFTYNDVWVSSASIKDDVAPQRWRTHCRRGGFRALILMAVPSSIRCRQPNLRLPTSSSPKLRPPVSP
jgi:hypothetical protein